MIVFRDWAKDTKDGYITVGTGLFLLGFIPIFVTIKKYPKECEDEE